MCEVCEVCEVCGWTAQSALVLGTQSTDEMLNPLERRFGRMASIAGFAKSANGRALAFKVNPLACGDSKLPHRSRSKN